MSNELNIDLLNLKCEDKTTVNYDCQYRNHANA